MIQRRTTVVPVTYKTATNQMYEGTHVELIKLKLKSMLRRVDVGSYAR